MQKTENLSSIPGLQRSPGGGNGKFLPGKSHGEPSRATVHGVEKNRMQLSNWAYTIYTIAGTKQLVCLGTGFRVPSLIITVVPESCRMLTTWPMRVIQTIKQTLKKPCHVISVLQIQNWDFNRKRSKKKESIPFPWASVLTELPWWLSGKESACNAGDPGLISRSGRSPGEGNSNPLQCSCLENPMDKQPGGLQSIELQRVVQDWSNSARTHAASWLLLFWV